MGVIPFQHVILGLSVPCIEGTVCLFLVSCPIFRLLPSVRFGASGESPQQREAHLRALQSREAQRRHSHHLQAQP